MTQATAETIDILINGAFWGTWLALAVTAIESLFPVLQGRKK
jgi:hypothetical protein